MKKPELYLYKGYVPFKTTKFKQSKTGFEIRLFIWNSRNEMHKATFGKRARTKENKYKIHFQSNAVFTSKYRKYAGNWIGDIHFFKQKIRIDWIAHEAAHAVKQHFYLIKKILNSRNEERFASDVGSMTEAVFAQLVEWKIKIVHRKNDRA